jgi:hypothetical protein
MPEPKYEITIKASKECEIMMVLHNILRSRTNNTGFCGNLSTEGKYYFSDDWPKEKIKPHPLVYAISDDLFCLCQMHGPALIASIMGGRVKDRVKGKKRIGETISQFIQDKLYEVEGKALSMEELKRIFDL